MWRGKLYLFSGCVVMVDQNKDCIRQGRGIIGREIEDDDGHSCS